MNGFPITSIIVEPVHHLVIHFFSKNFQINQKLELQKRKLKCIIRTTQCILHEGSTCAYCKLLDLKEDVSTNNLIKSITAKKTYFECDLMLHIKLQKQLILIRCDNYQIFDRIQ